MNQTLTKTDEKRKNDRKSQCKQKHVRYGEPFQP